MITADRIIETIDRLRFAEIAERHAAGGTAKYLNLQKWIPANLRRVHAAGLDVGSPRRVLDLGCGCGYFLYVCKLLGHDVLGIDSARPGSLFADMAELLGVPVVSHKILPFRKVPADRIDAVTAHMVTFNGHLTEPWGPQPWHSLLSQFDGVTISLQMNREPDGTIYPPGLREYFEAIGGEVNGPRVFIESFSLQCARVAIAALSEQEHAQSPKRMHPPRRG